MRVPVQVPLLGVCRPPTCTHLSLGSGPRSIGCSCRGNAPCLGTSIWKCQTAVRPGSLPSSPFSFFSLVASARVANFLRLHGDGGGCLSFSVPNICLYKQLCAGPPPSEPGLWAGEEVLCLSGGVGFLAPLGLAGVGRLRAWTPGVLGGWPGLPAPLRPAGAW